MTGIQLRTDTYARPDTKKGFIESSKLKRHEMPKETAMWVYLVDVNMTLIEIKQVEVMGNPPRNV